MSPLERAARRTFLSLRTRNFRLYMIGQVISGTGSWMQFVAQNWLVFRITHDATAVGFTLGLQFAPMLLFGGWAGVLVDRLDKRRLLIATAAAAGVLAVVLGVVTLAGVVQVWMVYVLAIALGAVTALDNPGRRAFVPEMVAVGDVANAVGLNSSVFTAARVIGPAIGGLVIAGVGVAWCFLLNAGSFVAVIWAFMAMQPAELRSTPPIARARRQFRDGLRYAWHNVPVRTALIITAVIGTFTFNYQVVFLPLVERDFGGGAATYGVLLALIGIGSLTGALWVAHYGRASLQITIAATVALGVATTAATFAPSLAIEMAVLPTVGISSMIVLSMGTAVCNEETAPEYRGRVMALFGVAFLGSTPIGAPIVGWVTETFSPRAGLGIGAAAALIAGAGALLVRDRLKETVPVGSPEIAVGTDPVVVGT